MCPARFFEVCEGDFSICVSSQKTQNTVTHRHTVTDTAHRSPPRYELKTSWFNHTKRHRSSLASLNRSTRRSANRHLLRDG